MNSKLVIAFLLTISLLVVTTSLHFEALRSLWRVVSGRGNARRLKMVFALTSVVGVHFIEIGLYACAYALGAGPLQLGTFQPGQTMGFLDYIYYSAETYSALGYGDVFPIGYLRLIACVSPLNGSLLLAWSGSFLFLLIRDDFVDKYVP
ncbi:MAG: ion channel [Candidatus Binatia bacterium]|jgi:ion channel